MIKNIIILGHSLNQIDLPYFKEILKYVEDVFWNVSYYYDEERKAHLKTLQEMSVKRSFVKMFKMSDIEII